MWPDKLDTEGATIYMETGDCKVMVTRKCYVQLSKPRPKVWTKKVWKVWKRDTWYEGLIHFCNRNAAIMWLKRYGEPGVFYALQNEAHWTSVRVENGYVWFHDGVFGISAETKRTCNFAIRNN